VLVASTGQVLQRSSPATSLYSAAPAQGKHVGSPTPTPPAPALHLPQHWARYPVCSHPARWSSAAHVVACLAGPRHSQTSCAPNANPNTVPQFSVFVADVRQLRRTVPSGQAGSPALHASSTL